MTCDVSVMTSLPYQVSILYMIMGYSFLFPMVQIYKNRPRGARVIVENKVAPFPDTV